MSNEKRFLVVVLLSPLVSLYLKVLNLSTGSDALVVFGRSGDGQSGAEHSRSGVCSDRRGESERIPHL